MWGGMARQQSHWPCHSRRAPRLPPVTLVRSGAPPPGRPAAARHARCCGLCAAGGRGARRRRGCGRGAAVSAAQPPCPWLCGCPSPPPGPPLAAPRHCNGAGGRAVAEGRRQRGCARSRGLRGASVVGVGRGRGGSAPRACRRRPARRGRAAPLVAASRTHPPSLFLFSLLDGWGRHPRLSTPPPPRCPLVRAPPRATTASAAGATAACRRPAVRRHVARSRAISCCTVVNDGRGVGRLSIGGGGSCSCLATAGRRRARTHLVDVRGALWSRHHAPRQSARGRSAVGGMGGGGETGADGSDERGGRQPVGPTGCRGPRGSGRCGPSTGGACRHAASSKRGGDGQTHDCEKRATCPPLLRAPSTTLCSHPPSPHPHARA